MAVGDSGRAVASRGEGSTPRDFSGRVGAHIHKGTPEATIGAPGATEAPGASREGSSGASPYGTGGDGG